MNLPQLLIVYAENNETKTYGFLNLLIMVLLFVGLIVLEIYLAKKESRWPGLILPILAFLSSFIVPLSFAFGLGDSRFGDYLMLFFAFLLANIPTFIYLAIYFAQREKLKRKKEIEKMNIKEL